MQHSDATSTLFHDRLFDLCQSSNTTQTEGQSLQKHMSGLIEFTMKDDMSMTASNTYRASQNDLPLFHTPGRQRKFYTIKGKRLCDIALVLCTLPLTLPLIALLALLVVSDGGRPFFGHQRIGRSGRSFKCWKIRSMVPDAEARLQEYLRKNYVAREEWDKNFKLTNDPRITRIGNFLRRSSLDELPQIWNILRGEMSFVGPRPITRLELELYGAAKECYQSMVPGLTGLWQVSGRNDISYKERVMLDVQYAETYSFLLDMRIILNTAGVVIKRSGR